MKVASKARYFLAAGLLSVLWIDRALADPPLPQPVYVADLDVDSLSDKVMTSFVPMGDAFYFSAETPSAGGGTLAKRRHHRRDTHSFRLEARHDGEWGPYTN